MIGILFLVLLTLGVPIVVVMALSALVYIQLSGNSVLFISYPQQLFAGLESYSLLAIPLFIVVGEVMNEAGLTRRLVGMSLVFVGRIKGGFAVVNLLTNMFAAAVMGSAVAQAAVMTQVLVPEMVAKGYNRAFSTATTLAGSLLAPVIPPSMAFIIYGVLAQISISDMLISGIIPGLLIALSFLIVLFIFGLFVEFPRGEGITFDQAKRDVVAALPSLSVPVVMVGAMIFGFMSPTETAAMAILHVLVIGHFFHDGIQLARLPGLLLRAGMTSAIVLGLIGTSNVFGWVLTFERVPQQISELLQTVTTNAFSFMLLLMAGLLLIGTVLDAMAALILLVPILQPVAVKIYGVDPFLFGVVVCVTLAVGLTTPPVGAALYVAAYLGGVPPVRLFVWLTPFLVAIMLVLVLLCMYPILVTALI